MKRQSYLTSSRRLPKAPLPFTLPSIKRESGGDGAGGGIAGAGAKWASPRADPVEETRVEENREEAAVKTAWGGAGIRAVRTQPDFPALSPAATENDPDAPSDSKSETRPTTFDDDDDDWAEDNDAMDFSEVFSLPEPAVSIPDTPAPPAPVKPHAAASSPRVLQNPARRQNLPPPAAHWAPAMKLQEMDHPKSRQFSRQPFSYQRVQQLPFDLKAIEEQPHIMKSKAETAHEVRRKAEEERERLQKERSNKKLRALEERMGLTRQQQESGEKETQSSDSSKLPPNGVATSTSQDGSLASQENESSSSPRVLLRRPKSEQREQFHRGGPVSEFTENSRAVRQGHLQPDLRMTPTNAQHMHDRRGPTDVTVSADSQPVRYPTAAPHLDVHRQSHPSVGQNVAQNEALHSRNFHMQNRRGRQPRHPSREQGETREPRNTLGPHEGLRHRPRSRFTDFDGPADNETREQWLERRRKKTETRDAVRSVIELVINRAVYGYKTHSRRPHSKRAGPFHASGNGNRREYSRRNVPQKPGTSSVHRSDSRRRNPRSQDAQQRHSHPTSQSESHGRLDGAPIMNPVEVKPPDTPAVTSSGLSAKGQTSRGITPAQLAVVESSPRQAPIRRLAPPPLRPAPWAPKVQKGAKSAQGPSPIATELRAEAEAKSALSQHGTTTGQATTSSESELRTSNFQQTDSQSDRALSKSMQDKRYVATDSQSRIMSSSRKKTRDSTERLADESLNAVRQQARSVTIPPSLGGNVRVLMKPNAGREGSRGTATLSPMTDSSGSGAQNAGQGTYRGRGGHRRGRVGRMEVARKDQTDFSKTLTNGTAAPRFGGQDLRQASGANSFSSLPPSSALARDEREESKAWAASNGAPPPTSFDEITRAFSNQPAAFPLVGAPMIPAVPVVPVIRTSTPQSSSISLDVNHTAWSNEKSWGQNRDVDETSRGWWPSSGNEFSVDVDVSKPEIPAQSRTSETVRRNHQHDLNSSHSSETSTKQGRNVAINMTAPNVYSAGKPKPKKFIKGPRKPKSRMATTVEREDKNTSVPPHSSSETEMTGNTSAGSVKDRETVSSDSLLKAEGVKHSYKTQPRKAREADSVAKGVEEKDGASASKVQSGTHVGRKPFTDSSAANSVKENELKSDNLLDESRTEQQFSSNAPHSKPLTGTRGRGKKSFGKPRRRDPPNRDASKLEQKTKTEKSYTEKDTSDSVQGDRSTSPLATSDVPSGKSTAAEGMKSQLNESVISETVSKASETTTSEYETRPAETRKRRAVVGKGSRRGESNRSWQKSVRPPSSELPQSIEIVKEVRHSEDQESSTETINVVFKSKAPEDHQGTLDAHQGSQNQPFSSDQPNGQPDFTERPNSDSGRGRGNRRSRGRGRGRGGRGGRGRGRGGRGRGRGGRIDDNSQLGESSNVTQSVVATAVTSGTQE